MRRVLLFFILLLSCMPRHAHAAEAGDVEEAIDAFMLAEFARIDQARVNATARFESDPPLLAAVYRKADVEYIRESRPLHIAAQDGNLAEVKALVEAGADIDAPMTLEGGMVTPLHAATRFGRLDVVEYLLREGADPNAGGGTILREAALLKRVDAVRLLLEHGADPNSMSAGGGSSLLALFMPFSLPPPSRVHEILRLLLEAEADPNAGKSITPLDAAMNRGNPVAIQMLRQFGAELPDDDRNIGDESPALHRAARDGDIVTLKALLEAGGDINQPNDFGTTPAYFAAEAGQYGTLRWLAAHGADLTRRSERPVDDIFFAAAMGDNIELMRICLEYGARVDYPAMLGLSPLARGVAGWMNSRDWSTAEFLIENGADVNWRDEIGLTPLHVMAAAHLWDFDRPGMERLLRAGADRDARDKDGLTPLHYAAARNNRRAMAVLMETR